MLINKFCPVSPTQPKAILPLYVLTRKTKQNTSIYVATSGFEAFYYNNSASDTPIGRQSRGSSPSLRGGAWGCETFSRCRRRRVLGAGGSVLCPQKLFWALQHRCSGKYLGNVTQDLEIIQKVSAQALPTSPHSIVLQAPGLPDPLRQQSSDSVLSGSLTPRQLLGTPKTSVSMCHI